MCLSSVGVISEQHGETTIQRTQYMSTYRPATSKMTRGPDKHPKYYTTRISVPKNFGGAGEGQLNTRAVSEL